MFTMNDTMFQSSKGSTRQLEGMLCGWLQQQQLSETNENLYQRMSNKEIVLSF